jgi:threonine dehydrogenase-like Zn-dependent dehydrogenase
MKAVRVLSGGGVSVEEVDTPRLAPDEVLLTVEYGGICGSDLHYAQHGRNGDYLVTSPLTLGHEISGSISAIGEAVTDVALGAPATVHPAQPCPEAGSKPTGLHLVPTTYLGSASTTPHTQGGFAEYVVVQRKQVRMLPEGLPIRRAVLAEPLGVALHAASLCGDIAGKRVLVVGCGPIGLLTILALSLHGPRELVATDLSVAALDLARSVGATATIRVPEQSAEEGAFDIVVEAAGATPSIRAAIASVAPGGVLVQLAIPATPTIEIPSVRLLSQEFTIRGAWRFDTEIDRALEVLRDHPEADGLITHEFSIDDAEEAFAIAADSEVSSKVILRLS